MADNLSRRDAEARYPGGDPFAELSRIISGGSQPQPRDDREDLDFDLDMDLEREVLGRVDDAYEAAAESMPPHAEAYRGEQEAAYREEPAPAVEQAGFADPLADEFADAFEAEFNAGGRWEDTPAAPAEPLAADAGAHAGWREPEARGAETSVLAEVDMDFGELDLTDDVPALEFDEPETEEGEPEAEEEAPARFHADAAPIRSGIEDELEALLAGDDMPYDAAPERRDESAYLPLRGAGHDAGACGRDAAEASEAIAPQDNYSFEPEDVYEEDSGYETEIPEEAVEEFAAPAFDEPEQQQPAASEEPEPRPDPFAVFAAMAPAAPVLSRMPQREPHPVEAAPVGEDDGYETVSVREDAVPVQDELDIPEIDYQDEAPLASALEAEFDLGELPVEPAPRQTVAETPAAAAGVDYDPQWLSYDDGQGAAHADDALYAEYAGADDYGADETPALAQHVAAEPEQPRRGNGMLIAAVVAGVALLGGIGAFALSFGGGDEGGSTTLVRADDEPLKVKPENPGGAAEPANQDSQAYRRVAGDRTEASAPQDRLVTTTEEPVDLAARALPANGLPGVEDEIEELDVAPPVKSEDRIEVSEQAIGVGTNDDLVAVQPRRVRTMIVRPDGTLVPREETAPLVASAQEGTDTAGTLAPAANDAQAAGEEAGTSAREIVMGRATPPAAGAESTLPAPRTVETVRITQESQAAAPAAAAEQAPAAAAPVAAAPAPRPAAEAQRPTQVAQAAPARNQPAAPAAPAAAAGEWSMQIASQPTAEGAQATYQDLARRYGSVIGGRGVNIVKADIPGKGTYYRVRIPSATRAEAISLCERYKAAGGSCFVSK